MNRWWELLRWGKTPDARAVLRQAEAAPVGDGSAPGSEIWQQFKEAVSGEWEEVTATFDAKGDPVELPDHFVPQAFKEGDVRRFDWQSRCSMLATDDVLSWKLRRLKPSVGCKEVATAYVEEERDLLSTPGELAGEDKTVLPDGSYRYGPTYLMRLVHVESCLYRAEGQRIRMVHKLKEEADTQKWVVDSLELHQERYDSPHTGRQELTGFGVGMPFFATKERLTPDEVSGSWSIQQRRAYALEEEGAFRLSSTEPGPARRHDNAEGRLMLPLKAFSVVHGTGADLTVMAAVLDEAGKLRVATHTYEDYKLECLELTVEAREG